ncbi:MAG TPA: hypothetical protein DD379_01760 [Cyanobacteria bacterium UBA11162]|nr:hypothetical protein [Cyanobacteria bacterium UBA11162]
MRRRLWSVLVLALLIITADFWVGSSRRAAQISALAQSQPSATLGLSLRPRAEGEFYLQREGRSGATLFRGTARISPGDLIKPVPGRRVTVFCSDGTPRILHEDIQHSLSSLGCPTNPQPSLERNGSRIRPPRNPVDPQVPYIISPRATTLLFGSKPTLRWHQARGANSYEVRIIRVDEGQEEEVVWERKRFKETTVVPDNLSLQPGVTYLLTVKADNDKFSYDEGAGDTGFKVISEPETQRIRMAKQQLDSLEMSDEAKALVLAEFYADQGLIFDAIQTLEDAITKRNQTAIIYRTVGDLYYSIGLGSEAKPYYCEAVKQAEDSGNVEEQALALEQMGEVYALLGQKDEAIYWLRQASTKYELLGDLLHVQKLAERIEGLSL